MGAKTSIAIHVWVSWVGDMDDALATVMTHLSQGGVGGGAGGRDANSEPYEKVDGRQVVGGHT